MMPGARDMMFLGFVGLRYVLLCVFSWMLGNNMHYRGSFMQQGIFFPATVSYIVGVLVINYCGGTISISLFGSWVRTFVHFKGFRLQVTF